MCSFFLMFRFVFFKLATDIHPLLFTLAALLDPFFCWNYRVGNVNGSITDELKGQNATLRDCIEQLQVFEASRSDLVAFLREVLQEQVVFFGVYMCSGYGIYSSGLILIT